jgi:polar amino acid transport system substrate-binding protein
MRILGALVLLLAGACASAPVVDIARSGKLRVAIAVGPAASPFWTTRDPATGAARGVTVELGKAAAARLGVPLELVEFPNSGEIMMAASKDEWDISFMPADPERDKYVDMGPAYVVYDSAWLVRAGINSVAEVDRAGMRVASVEGTSTSRAVVNTLQHATLTLFAKPDVPVRMLARGELDAFAMGREALQDVARTIPGARVLDEAIQTTGMVVVVPKGRPAVRAWAARFVEEAKKDGTLRRVLDAEGFHRVAVAPPR